MPHYSSNILPEGAFFDIIVFPPVSVFNKHLQEKTQCPSTRLRALIDTGASLSCINDDVAKTLNLVARDKQMVGNAGGGSEQFLYDVGFHLPIPNTHILPLQVFGVNLKNQPYQALIGRDVLKFCNFIYSGASSFWTLSI